MTAPSIHPTAIVANDASLGENVVVGPYAVIEGDVHVGKGTTIGPHAVIHRFARLGDGNEVHAHAVIADTAQDYSFTGEETWVKIGDENLIREGVTIHRSTDPAMPTRIGSRCFLMAYSHVAHGCQVGDGVILTNNAMLGGHVEVGDNAILGGGVAVHQFCRVGGYTMIAGVAGILKDILPFTMAKGAPARHYRLNTVGLRRSGVSGERYRSLERGFRALRAGGGLDGLPDTPELAHLRAWLEAPTKRGLAAFVSRDAED